MMELTSFSFTLIIALIVSCIAVLFIILAIFYCLRRNSSTPYKRAPIVKSSSDESKSSAILKDKKETSDLNIVDLNKLESGLDAEEGFRFLGINLNDIPYIDDSKCSSYIDLTWNPYQPLTNKS